MKYIKQLFVIVAQNNIYSWVLFVNSQQLTVNSQHLTLCLIKDMLFEPSSRTKTENGFVPTSNYLVAFISVHLLISL